MADLANAIRSFATVIECGSFTAASARLGLTQSTVSKQILWLEAHLGIRLFHRTTRSLNLTDEGAAFHESSLQVLAAIEQAEASVGLSGRIRGRLRLTAPLSLAEARLIPMLDEFMGAHPAVEVELVLSDHALNLVADHIDLAIRVGHLGDDRFESRLIGRCERVAVASPAYLAQAGHPASPADLTAHNCVRYALSAAGRRWRFADGSEVLVAGNMVADSPHALRAASLAGIGVVANARWLFEAELAAGTLVELFPGNPPVAMPIHQVMPAGRHVTARASALAAHFRRRFAEDPLLAPD